MSELALLACHFELTIQNDSSYVFSRWFYEYHFPIAQLAADFCNFVFTNFFHDDISNRDSTDFLFAPSIKYPFHCRIFPINDLTFRFGRSSETLCFEL